jgi:hypothetical protein
MGRKKYASPKLTIHGDVAKITLQGGFNHIDVPIGTPIGPGTTAPDVAS